MPLMFVYAQLEDNKDADTAATPGILRKRGNDGAARFSSKSASLVHGEVKEVKDFDKYDKMEAPEYSRVPITLTDGRKAYAYEDIQNNWSSLPLIENGKFK